jgi:hypothetical protein
MAAWSKSYLIPAGILLVAGLVWGIYAVESDREVRVLCGLFQPGTPRAEMDRILSTAHFLRVEESREADILARTIYSRINLGRNGCVVELAGGVVRHTRAWPDGEQDG